MKVQSINNIYQYKNPNMKALYFSKVVPIMHDALDYKNQKVTNKGIKYIEDNSAKLTAFMKEAFAECHFIESIADMCEVFIVYLGEEYDRVSGHFTSTAGVHFVMPARKTRETFMFSSNDKYSPEGARLKLLSKISHEESCEENIYENI